MSDIRRGLRAGSDYTNHSNASSMFRSSPDSGPPAQHTRRFSLPTAHLLNSFTSRGKRESQAPSQQSKQQPQQQTHPPKNRANAGRRVLSSMGLSMKSSENLTSASMYDVSLSTQHKHTSSSASRGSSEKTPSYKKADNTFLTRSKAWGSAGKRLLGGHRSSSKDMSNPPVAQKEPWRAHSSRSTLVEPLRDRPGPRLQALSMSPDEAAPKEDLWEAYNLKNESREDNIHARLTRQHVVSDKPPVLELPGITVPWDENEDTRLKTPPSTAPSVPGLLRAGVTTPQEQQLSRRSSRGDSLSLLTVPGGIGATSETTEPTTTTLRRPKSAAFDITSAITGDELQQHLGGPVFLSPVGLQGGSRISMSFIDSSLKADPTEDQSHILPPIESLSIADPPLDVAANQTIQPYSASTSPSRPLKLQVDTKIQNTRNVSPAPSSFTVSPAASGSPAPSDGSLGDANRMNKITRNPVLSLNAVSSSSTPTPDTPRQDLDEPPMGSRLEHKIEQLNRRLGQLAVQQQNLETLINDLNRATRPVECSYETRKEIKKSLVTFKTELADVKKEQHDLGLKLTRYLKKKEDQRTLGDSSGGMWSRRVTG
ncbi:hypothetical protein KEM56_004113 [Ascosphaera pollenicola]|nr:hypothetical protein KEM56_004113 [Ascosphaera pollenicola]